MVTELLSRLPATLGAFAPQSPAGDRPFWERLPSAIRGSLIADAEKISGYEYPAMPATLYMEFCRTGNRSRFEERYFARRRALNAFALAECAENEGRWIDGVIDGIDAISGEAGWQLPAHNSYIRDTPQLILPDTASPVIDLFAAETGADLAMVRYLLKDRLDAVSPTICARIERLLRERIFAPYLERHFWWMGNGDEPMCNWTPWCTQNVLVAAGTGALGQDELRRIVGKAARSLDCFLKDYGDDGCCSEGAEYYRHAGLCLFGAVEVLDALAPGVFSPLYREEKIRNIARYICNVHVSDKYYINFADCSAVAGRAGVREYLFGKRTGATDLVRFAAEDWSKREDPTLSEESTLSYRLQAVAAAREIASAAGCDPETLLSAAKPATYAAAEPPAKDVWYPSVGVFVARSPSLCLAVKAGGNGDSHNHNDTGSFILYKEGHPCIIDVGVENYTRKTFSPQRYEIWTMQSAWHNLPTFGDFMQSDGAQYCARDVSVKAGDGESSISMELAGAWKKECGVRSFRRTVTLSKAEETVTVEDVCDSAHAPYLSLMTICEPGVRAHSAESGSLRIALGDLASLDVDGVSGSALLPDVAVDVIDIDDERLRRAWPERMWRIRIPFARRLKLRIR